MCKPNDSIRPAQGVTLLGRKNLSLSIDVQRTLVDKTANLLNNSPARSE